MLVRGKFNRLIVESFNCLNPTEIQSNGFIELFGPAQAGWNLFVFFSPVLAG